MAVSRCAAVLGLRQWRWCLLQPRGAARPRQESRRQSGLRRAAHRRHALRSSQGRKICGLLTSSPCKRSGTRKLKHLSTACRYFSDAGGCDQLLHKIRRGTTCAAAPPKLNEEIPAVNGVHDCGTVVLAPKSRGALLLIMCHACAKLTPMRPSSLLSARSPRLPWLGTQPPLSCVSGVSFAFSSSFLTRCLMSAVVGFLTRRLRSAVVGWPSIISFFPLFSGERQATYILFLILAGLQVHSKPFRASSFSGNGSKPGTGRASSILSIRTAVPGREAKTEFAVGPGMLPFLKAPHELRA